LYFFDGYTSLFYDKTDDVSFSFFGRGPMEEEETIMKGDYVIVELNETLEDLYTGDTL